MANFIIIAILIVLVGSACFYIWKEKKKGNKCIGCPMSANGSCQGHCASKFADYERHGSCRNMDVSSSCIDRGRL